MFDPTFLPTGHVPSSSTSKRTGKDQHNARGLRSRASVAALVGAVRDPFGAVEGWWDGSTREEREQKLRSDARKRVGSIELGSGS
jgi:hypothetical protein